MKIIIKLHDPTLCDGCPLLMEDEKDTLAKERYCPFGYVDPEVGIFSPGVIEQDYYWDGEDEYPCYPRPKGCVEAHGE